MLGGGSLFYACLAGPVGVHFGGWVLVGEKADEVGRSTQRGETFLHFGIELLCNVVC